MNQYKKKILEKEFPFLTQVIGTKTEPTEIKIKRVDDKLLKMKGYSYEYKWSDGDIWSYNSFSAITEDNKILELESSGNFKTGWGVSEEWDAPTIGEQLFSKGIRADFIVEDELSEGRNGERNRSITIYKMNKFDLVDYHCKQIQFVADQIKGEITTCCCN